ncbi:bifunctional [glutamine synthetase] adenylyltransferase/[glutamine synthetase]-adenylyl-L-tyrosine phosphorylase [Nakamurella flavida]|uniref:Bifunctional [glutamine synthetase] adenylyltransferase/[glutamine synthetase]-adenylyl-L-tyrosine phosphorylase n=1 Tax=Nakamurella flavida TaxID=363630 RepID=A0A938YJ79_9ACTN|nr:bifunctional [glutamine synthetase] adenylyltransferase/[glutamine synthetase]-adenylyl-L-tyrosine phosphorylase [Nakamurella flavida]MBM9476124.1 bifunctional [glutamine synthetase] adenylyltransferase/[glutamine synthetase]-adenylyl-L-tyrosine phosphorylase [Nakamurella flavida]MDP9777131.1 glutamate-ammonia-ligase adenylyltransferase [Nakamurella flavida]
MSRPAGRSLARYGLPDTDRVRAELRAVDLADDAGPAVGAEGVLAAIGRTGRPELAVTALTRVVEAIARAAEDGGSAARRAAAGERADLLRHLAEDARFRGRMLGVLGGSIALGDHLAVFPEDWRLLVTEPPAERLLAPSTLRGVLGGAVGIDPDAPPCTGSEGARATVTGPAAVKALRHAYRSLLLIIAGHDLAPAVEPSLPTTALPAVCQALSDLADATLQTALSVAAAALPAHGAPARLSVVAMGKCGARELNYLSDVDVIFVADHPLPPTAPDGPSGSAAEPGERNEHGMLATATALAAGLMRICEQVAWEVDANLRPEGKAGALVRTPSGHAGYYRRWAHTWEFQALLKARPAAGCDSLGEEFISIVAPGVWSAAGRDSFVDDVQAMRRRVEDNIPEGLRSKELKLGAGGLRDVEFAVQLLQLVHGRTDADLRLPGTLMALRSLIRGGYVGRSDGAEMAAAYTFLRRAEHRLQLQRLRRTHLLPDDHADLEWLARTDGYTSSGTSSAAEVFTAERLRHGTTVRRLHEKLFYRPLLHAVAAVAEDELRLSPQAAQARLAALGFRTPDAALRHIAALTTGLSRRAAIQRTLLPVLLETFSASPDPDGGLLSYRQVSEALADTPWYLRLLRDEGSVAQRLAGLLGGSRMIGDLLTRAPDVLQLLVDDRALLEPEPEQVAGALWARSHRAVTAREAVDVARSARRHEMLRLACGDLLGLIEVTDIARGLSSVAEISIRAAQYCAQKQVTSERGAFRARMTVIAMGRLGGGELGYSSDADVMYVAEALPGEQAEEALADAAAVADLMARLLGRPSPDPPLVVDAGLRPEGRNGRLVRTLDSFRTYWERFALPWERQALLRARVIAGDEELGARFIEAADAFRYPEGGLSQSDVVEIRRIKARVDAERLPRGADPTTHTKLGRGGLADIEWTVQLLQLQHAREVPEMRVTSTVPAICAARDAGLLSATDAQALITGWLTAAHTRNAIMLVRGKPEDQIPRQGRELAAIARARGYPAGEDPGVFVDDYRRATRKARRVVDHVFDGG